MHPLPFSGGPRYAVLFWGTYLLWVALETIGSRTKRSGDRSRVSDRGSFSLILILLWVALGADFALSFLLPQANILWNRTAIFYLGISLMLAGMAFRFYAMSVLGRFFTYDVAVHPSQTVVEAGPISVHPPSFLYWRSHYSRGTWSGTRKLGWTSDASRLYGGRLWLSNICRGSRAGCRLGRALSGIYAPDPAPHPICVLARPVSSVGRLPWSMVAIPLLSAAGHRAVVCRETQSTEAKPHQFLAR